MRIGFVTDIHEDVQNLENAFRILEREKCDRLVCLGDMVGFTLPFYRYIETRNAAACLRLVKENCSAVVAGNHDLYAVKKTPEYQAGFPYGDQWYALDYDIRAQKARNRIWLYEDSEIRCRLGDGEKEFLFGLQEMERREWDGVKFMFSHFCYPDVSGSAIFFPSQSFHLKKHLAFMAEHDCAISLSGHGHPEGALVVNEYEFIQHGFKTVRLSKGPHWIVIPCVARTSRKNGVMVFDTSERSISTISFQTYDPKDQ